MAFDITTARPVKPQGFDISTARPEVEQTPQVPQKTGISRFLPGEEKVQKLISERADPVETLRKEVETPFDFANKPLQSLAKPFVTAAKLADVPVSRASAAIGGLGLGLQKTKGFKESLKMAGEGLRGEKQFRSFDPARAAGVPSPVATGLELFTEIAVPMKVLSGISRALRGPIKRINDVKLLKVGNDLIKASDDAVKPVAQRLTKAYEPINDVPVDPSKVLDDAAKLPKEIINHLEDNLGNLDEFLQGFNIQKARELKRVLGKLRPSAFEKAKKGGIELVTDEQINKSYSSIKKSMQKALKDVGLEKEAKNLLEADDLFSQTMNASRFIKRTIVDPTLRAPTKIGRAASGLEKEADVSFRTAINILKNSGFKQSRNINKSINALESFNKSQKIKKFIGSLGRAVVFGGVAGGTAGRILGKDQ